MHKILYTTSKTYNRTNEKTVKHYALVVNDQNEVTRKITNSDSTLYREGLAILLGLYEVIKDEPETSEIRSSSVFWTRALNENWKVKKKDLISVANALKKAKSRTNTKFYWIPNETNIARKKREFELDL